MPNFVNLPDSELNPPPPAPKNPKHRIVGLLILVLVSIVPGMLLGLAKGWSREGGDLGQGFELGWKYAIAFLVALTIVMAVLQALLKLRTPEVVCFIVLMFLFRLLLRTTSLWVEGQGEFTLASVGEDLIYGMLVGCGVYYAMRYVAGRQGAKHQS